MKILSFNVRGLVSSLKKKEVRELIHSYKIDFCCLQKSKLDNVNDEICNIIWGDGRHCSAFKEAIRRSGGIISIWDVEVFSVLSFWHMEGALIVNGLWGIERLQCCLINEYAPCDVSEN